MFRPDAHSGHSTDSEDPHADEQLQAHPRKRARRQAKNTSSAKNADGPQSLQNLDTYVFRADPNLIDYRAKAFKHQKQDGIKAIIATLKGESSEYHQALKEEEKEFKRLSAVLDSTALRFAENIEEEFEAEVARAKAEREKELAACRQQLEADLRNALDGVESALADLQDDNAITVVTQELSGIQPGITKRTLRSRNGKKTNKPKPTKRRVRREFKYRQADYLLLPAHDLQDDLTLLASNMDKPFKMKPISTTKTRKNK
ncbi:hypothetical protein PTSG_06813 [Salpingoeca rosetta]|uniref:Uncharacterized protein n=1 Tax=Salpingoeca rosetta (strain ATCC 50818 / BSB-021) TaxID=946362 RepID=F2UEV9_SALR5|nr:uncharacterized protein PTSG_06813 [Salpingoeca rosetta]EGD75159.1 hypothetical protein PTSG_06813 [Salpingoeca rosetta]|eukprot:XP_004992212.1 hypothetical protein PTSG_06813 [Salpingoeca rosetta]